MAMNKNTVLGYATLIMIIVGVVLILLGAYRYEDVAGWGFASVGIGFFAIAWVFNALKGRVWTRFWTLTWKYFLAVIPNLFRNPFKNLTNQQMLKPVQHD